MRLRLGLGAIALLAALAAPATSPAATKFGANISAVPPAGSNYICAHPCTMWNSALSGGPSGLTDPTLAAPITGVVVKYEIITTGITGPTTLHLRVVHQLTALNWTGFGSSSPDVLPAISSDQTFPARVPITVGDFVALESTAPIPKFTVAYTGAQASGSNVTDSDNLMAVMPTGTSVTPETNTSRAIALEATVEPDADADEFGDESQDQCVGSAGPNNGCPLPAAAPTPSPATTTPVSPANKKKCKKAKKRSAAAAKKCKRKK